MEAFVFMVSNPPDAPDNGVVIAATRCGAVGVLNCAQASEAEAVRQALARIQRFARGPLGVKVDLGSPAAAAILQLLPEAAEWVILAGEPLPDGLGVVVPARRVLVEVVSEAQAARAVEWGCAGLIAHGERWARELAAKAKVPVWVTGIGPETVAACSAAGVAGVIIEQAPVNGAVRALDALLQRWREALASQLPANAVMLQYQQLMAQFLETQETVMQAYLAAVPAASPQLPAPASEANDSAELLRIVSERTGYPLEMLDPDAALEADLGIDSIKRAEILTVWQRRGAPGGQPAAGVIDQLTSARTLREMAHLLRQALPAAGRRTGYPAELALADRLAAALPSVGGRPVRPSPGSNHPVPRFVLTVTAKPRRRSKPQYYPGRISILTDDETGLAAGIAQELNRNGERAFLLRHNPDAVIVDEDLVTADLRDTAAIEAAVGLIRQEYGPIGAVIHLLPLRAGAGAPDGFAEWRELMQLDVRSLYALARATEADLKRAGRAGGALFAVVTGRGGDFGLHPNPQTPPTHYAVADFTKTLALEFTGVLCRVVDVDPTDPVRILREKLIAELTSPDETLQTGLPGDRRLTIVPQAEPFSMRTARQIQSDWVILLTGGARGITAEIARGLAERCQPALVLVGASPLPAENEPADTAHLTDAAALKAALAARLQASGAEARPADVEAAYLRLRKDREIRRTLDTLRHLGSRVAYHSVDVRNQAAFGELIDSIYQDYGRLDAVIHGAGVIEDKLLRDKTPESFDRVVDTKADSTFLLSRKLRPESLQCLLFMSSITAAFGNRAQADYAAADGILNGFATRLAAQWPGRVAALNWGPWDEAGMVSPEMRQQFLARAVPLIPLAGGTEAALREIEAGPPHDPLVALGDGPWSKLAVPAGTPRLEIHAYGSMP